jgi:fructose-1,6-bisphosphatase/inositol monophosphatase family enzyme
MFYKEIKICTLSCECTDKICYNNEMTDERPDFTIFLEELFAQLKLFVEENFDLTQATGKINHNMQKSIAMDEAMEGFILSELKKLNQKIRVFSEEIGLIDLHEEPEYLIAFDPLDGSANFKYGRGLLPFGTLVCVFEGVDPGFDKVICAGAIEYTKDLQFYFNGDKTYDKYNMPVEVGDDWESDPHKPFYIDIHKGNRKKYLPLLMNLMVPRHSGSTIGNLVYTLANTSACIGSNMMNPEEVGTVTALLRGATAKVVDDSGNLFQEKPFVIHKKYSVLGGGEGIVDFIIAKINEKAGF